MNGKWEMFFIFFIGVDLWLIFIFQGWEMGNVLESGIHIYLHCTDQIKIWCCEVHWCYNSPRQNFVGLLIVAEVWEWNRENFAPWQYFFAFYGRLSCVISMKSECFTDTQMLRQNSEYGRFWFTEKFERPLAAIYHLDSTTVSELKNGTCLLNQSAKFGSDRTSHAPARKVWDLFITLVTPPSTTGSLLSFMQWHMASASKGGFVCSLLFQKKKGALHQSAQYRNTTLGGNTMRRFSKTW